MRRRGFTLIELIVVVAIIIILAAILLPMITNRIDDARISRLASEYRTIKTAVAMYYADVGALPQNLLDLYNPGTPPDGWRGPYIDKAPSTTSPYVVSSPFNTNIALYSDTGTWDSIAYSQYVYLSVARYDGTDLKIANGLANQLDRKVDNGDLNSGVLQVTSDSRHLVFFLMGILP